MTYCVVKYSVMEGNENTNQNKAFSGNSPLSVTLSNGQVYSWGPNDTHTLQEPFATEAITFDNRLKIISRS